MAFSLFYMHTGANSFHNYCNLKNRNIVPFFSLAVQGTCLWLDTSSVNAAIVNTYKSACERCTMSNGHSVGHPGVYKSSPISVAKAVKNYAELEGMQNSHLR